MQDKEEQAISKENIIGVENLLNRLSVSGESSDKPFDKIKIFYDENSNKFRDAYLLRKSVEFNVFFSNENKYQNITNDMSLGDILKDFNIIEHCDNRLKELFEIKVWVQIVSALNARTESEKSAYIYELKLSYEKLLHLFNSPINSSDSSLVSFNFRQALLKPNIERALEIINLYANQFEYFTPDIDILREIRESIMFNDSLPTTSATVEDSEPKIKPQPPQWKARALFMLYRKKIDNRFSYQDTLAYFECQDSSSGKSNYNQLHKAYAEIEGVKDRCLETNRQYILTAIQELEKLESCKKSLEIARAEYKDFNVNYPIS